MRWRRRSSIGYLSFNFRLAHISPLDLKEFRSSSLNGKCYCCSDSYLVRVAGEQILSANYCYDVENSILVEMLAAL